MHLNWQIYLRKTGLFPKFIYVERHSFCSLCSNICESETRVLTCWLFRHIVSISKGTSHKEKEADNAQHGNLMITDRLSEHCYI